MKFMLAVKGNAQSEAGALPTSEQLACMNGFNEELLKAGVLLDMSGLHPVSQSVRVKYQAGKRTVIDGPFAEAKEVIAGYWVIQVKSRDEAVEWAKRAPMDFGIPAGESAELEIRQLYELDEFGENAGVEGARELEKKLEAQKS
jgi:hypothetical protein